MFENRPQGRNLAKIVSYGYVAMGILLSIVTIGLNSDTGAYALAQRGASIEILIFGVLIYFIFAAAIYLLSIKYENDSTLWKLYIIIAVLNFIIIGFSIILVLFSLLLIIAGADIRKELI
ncbi:hypothetical protein [Methanobrevibacter sp.]|uniref:hypothetical protein n=1 Tax=Methanobrevibacter sp. TaxID=66852 RepID=UPI00388DBCE9